MKTKKNLIKFAAIFLLLAIMTSSFVACDKDDPVDPNGENVTKLSFKAASGYDYLKTLDGTLVTISGYMATSSPVDGSFMFLMNLPYQSCPFCVPNTSQLSNMKNRRKRKKIMATLIGRVLKSLSDAKMLGRKQIQRLTND